MANLQFQDFGVSNGNKASNDGNSNAFPTDGRIGDKNALTGDDTSSTSAKNFFSWNYVQQYFDVDSDQVYSRLLYSMYPTLSKNFILDILRPTPDLYGPFWICVTLIFTTAICGNLTRFIESMGVSRDGHFESDFRLVSTAMTIIFCYLTIVPLALYWFLWYRRSLITFSYIELLSAYGYSLGIFVLVSILWLIQMSWFRSILLTGSVIVSGLVLARAIWPAVKDDKKTIAVAVVLGIFCLHGLLAIAFKESFFDVAVPTDSNKMIEEKFSTPMDNNSNKGEMIGSTKTSPDIMKSMQKKKKDKT